MQQRSQKTEEELPYLPPWPLYWRATDEKSSHSGRLFASSVRTRPSVRASNSAISQNEATGRPPPGGSVAARQQSVSAM